MASAPPPQAPSGPPPSSQSSGDKASLLSDAPVTRREYEDTLKELRRIKEAQQSRSSSIPPARSSASYFRVMGGDESSGGSTCGRIFCCWTSSCCRAVRADASSACEGMGKLMKRGDFLGLVAVMIFILAWAVFIGGAVWSSTYYSEYYCTPAMVNSSTPVPTTNGSKLNVAGYNIPIPAEENPCMPASKPERRHFPMKLSHWIPGIIISFSYLCMCGFTFRDVTKADVPLPENVSKDECVCCLMCVKSVLLMCSVAWACIGLIMAFIYFILMVSFVDVLAEAKKHVAVPTVCVVIQCGLLVLGLILGFLAKWRTLVGDQEEDEENKLY